MKTLNVENSSHAICENTQLVPREKARRALRVVSFALGVALTHLSGIVVEAQDYTYSTTNGMATIIRYGGPGGAVNIPWGFYGTLFIAIGDHAFSWNASVTSVTMPWSITNIGNGVFEHCTRLTSVTIGERVETIGSAAFSGCTSLTSSTIPSSVTNIGRQAFSYCDHLSAISVEALNRFYSSNEGVLFNKKQNLLIECPPGKAGGYSIPAGVASIGDYGFYSCTGLSDVMIPSTVTNIGDAAFAQCTGLTNVAIGNSVTSIGKDAFFHCTNLTNVSLPDSVTWIGVEAFYACSSLTSVTIPNSVTNIGDFAFLGCTTLSSLTMPNSVTCIEDGMFGECASLTNITIGNTVTSIQVEAFYGCTSLTGVTIPRSVTNIADYAFRDCANLSSVVIPNSVSQIADQVFSGCTNLTNITVEPFNPVYSSAEGVLFDKKQNALIQCPQGKTGSYIIPSGVTSIGDNAFSGCTRLTSIAIPDSVTNIGYWAFASCTNLKEVYFEGNAPNVDGSPFQHASNVLVYYMPDTTGWGTSFGGCATAIRQPRVLTGDADFGIQSDHFGFNITWASGKAVVVEACTNLVDRTWVALSTNTLTTGRSYFFDAQATNHPARFYRIRWP